MILRFDAFPLQEMIFSLALAGNDFFSSM